MGSADEPFICKLILAVIGSGLGAVFGYLLGLRQARILRQNDLELELQRTQKDDRIFLNYCIELIRESHKCGKLTLEKIAEFLKAVELEKGNAALNEVAMANAIRFSSSDLARLHSLFKGGEISSNFLKTTPSTEEIFKLINSIDALPAMQQRAISHSKQYFTNLKEPNLSLYQCHNQILSLVESEEMGRLLGSIAHEQVNREPIQALNEIIRPLVQKVMGIQPRIEKHRQIIEYGRIAEEAARSIEDQKLKYSNIAKKQQGEIKKCVDEIERFCFTFLNP